METTNGSGVNGADSIPPDLLEAVAYREKASEFRSVLQSMVEAGTLSQQSMDAVVALSREVQSAAFIAGLRDEKWEQFAERRLEAAAGAAAEQDFILVQSEKPDLTTEGIAISNILGTLNELTDRSRDRVLAVVIDLAAPGPFGSHSQSSAKENIARLHAMIGDGDTEGP